MKLPEIPILILYILSAAGLVAAARFRLSALLAAGATQPGHKRVVRTAWVLLWDTITFAGVGFLLRLDLFPLFMSGLLVFGATAGLLAVQWAFKRAPKAPGAPAGPLPSVAGGVQNLQDVALGLGYNRAEEWVKGEYRKNQWRIGLGYQGITIALCLALRVLDALQGGWLYILFSLLWQGGVTGFLHWKFDRKRTVAPSSGGVAPTPGPPKGPQLPPSSAADQPKSTPTRTPFFRLPPNAPGTRPPGTPPRAERPPTNAAANRAPAGKVGGAPRSGRRKFATRSDVQAFVALSAGFWCGLFDRLFGWWYGFASVTAFRSILSLGSPIASGLLGRYAPPAVQAYLNVKPKKSLLSLEYLKSREFWYGPGMGLLGGIAGAVLRWVLFNR